MIEIELLLEEGKLMDLLTVPPETGDELGATLLGGAAQEGDVFETPRGEIGER